MAEEDVSTPEIPEAPSHEREQFFSGLNNIAEYKQQLDDMNLSEYKRRFYVPPQLTMPQLRLINEQSLFQYGTGTNQRTNRELYLRQERAARESFSATAGQWTADAGIFTAGSALATAMKAGPIKSIVAPMAASLGLMYPVRSVMDKELSKRQESLGIATDISTFQDQLGLGSASFREINNTALDLRGSMSKGGFWSKKDQLKLHSIAVGEGILDSLDPKSTDTKGNVQQYKKNFEELKSVTKDIVETLQTTMEGGLSLIKDMKDKGYTNMQKIRTELLRAKAFGDATGVGTENMLRIQDAGGERAYTQGMTREYGASSYRASYAQLNQQALTSPGMAQSINRVGGLEAATQIVNDANTNFIQGKLGTQMWAAITKSDGSVDNKFLARMNRGDASASEIVNRAHNRGAAMDESGRALAERRKMEFLEKSGSDGTAFLQVQAGIKGMFHAWKKEMPNVSSEAAAQKFAEMQLPGADLRAQSLFADQLLAADKSGYLKAVKLSAEAKDNRLSGGVAPINPLRRKYNEATAYVSGYSSAAGKGMVDYADKTMTEMSTKLSNLRYGLAGWGLRQTVGLFGNDEERANVRDFGIGVLSPVNLLSDKQMIEHSYSLNGINRADVEAFRRSKSPKRMRSNESFDAKTPEELTKQLENSVSEGVKESWKKKFDNAHATNFYKSSYQKGRKSSDVVTGAFSKLTDTQLDMAEKLALASPDAAGVMLNKEFGNRPVLDNDFSVAMYALRQTRKGDAGADGGSSRKFSLNVLKDERKKRNRSYNGQIAIAGSFEEENEIKTKLRGVDSRLNKIDVNELNSLYNMTNQVSSGVIDISEANKDPVFRRVVGLGESFGTMDPKIRRDIVNNINRNLQARQENNAIERDSTFIEYEAGIEGKTIEEKRKELEAKRSGKLYKSKKIDKVLQGESLIKSRDVSLAALELIGSDSSGLFPSSTQVGAYFSEKIKAKGAMASVADQTIMRIFNQDPSKLSGSDLAARASILRHTLGVVTPRAHISGLGSLMEKEKTASEAVGRAEWLAKDPLAVFNSGAIGSKLDKNKILSGNYEGVDSTTKTLLQETGYFKRGKKIDEINTEREGVVKSLGKSISVIGVTGFSELMRDMETNRQKTNDYKKENPGKPIPASFTDEETALKTKYIAGITDPVTGKPTEGTLPLAKLINTPYLSYARGLYTDVANKTGSLSAARGEAQVTGVMNQQLLHAGFINRDSLDLNDENSYDKGTVDSARMYKRLGLLAMKSGGADFKKQDMLDLKKLFAGQGADLLAQFSDKQRRILKTSNNEKEVARVFGEAIAGAEDSSALKQTLYEKHKEDLTIGATKIDTLMTDLKKYGKDTKEYKDKMSEIREQEIINNNIKMKKDELETKSTGGSNMESSTHVQPPVMNYWNNRWAL